jgi:hypothetical protein
VHYSGEEQVKDFKPLATSLFESAKYGDPPSTDEQFIGLIAQALGDVADLTETHERQTIRAFLDRMASQEDGLDPTMQRLIKHLGSLIESGAHHK